MAHVNRGLSLDRRTFLRGAGAMIALPFLDAMLPALAPRAVRERLAPPVRSLFLFAPNGQNMGAWTPKETGTGFSLTPTLEALKKHRDRFSIISGLALEGANAQGDGPGDHARSSAAFLTGAHPKKTGGADIQNGISIDQVIAQKAGKDTALMSLELGGEGGKFAGICDSGYSCAYVNSIAWRTPTTPLPKETQPREVFKRLFGDIESFESQVEEAQKRALRRSVLDLVQDDMKRVRGNLGASDRAKLDEYLTAIRELENRLEKADRSTNSKVDLPRDFFAEKKDADAYEERIRRMFDLIALAFQGDLVRVVTFSFANDGSNRSYPNIGIAEGHHDLSHHGGDPAKHEKVQKINAFYMRQIEYLFTALLAKKDGADTIFDSSAILYGSGISDGDTHRHHDLPILIAGHAGRKLRHGKHIAVRPGTPLAALHLAFLRLNGLGDPTFADAKEPLAL